MPSTMPHVPGREIPVVAASPIHERFRSASAFPSSSTRTTGAGVEQTWGSPIKSNPLTITTTEHSETEEKVITVTSAGQGTQLPLQSSSASIRSKASADTHLSAPLTVNINGPRPRSWHGQDSASASTQLALPPVDEDLDTDTGNPVPANLPPLPRDKASRLLGIRHERSMEPIPASTRTSMAVSTRSTPAPPPSGAGPSATNQPLCALYLVSGLPKNPHTWTLADTDSTTGLHHTEGAVNRWWRPEVLGSTVTPGTGGSKKGLRKKHSAELLKGAGVLSKQDVGKMLSKGLKLSFTREVEIVASTLQPPSTVHSFTFNLPPSSNPYGSSPSGDLLRNSPFVGGGGSLHGHAPPSLLAPYSADPYARPSTALLGPPPLPGGSQSVPNSPINGQNNVPGIEDEEGATYHGVCLTVWSHADAERTAAIRRALDGPLRARKESAHSLRASRLKALRAKAGGTSSAAGPSRRRQRAYSDAETDPEGGMETEADGAITESEYDGASTVGHAPGESTVFLPGDAVFWLPYALTLVSRFPIYDLMRDYLTLSWARFSKDVQSHTLQISKILAHPAPRAGELVRLDASAKGDAPGAGLEVVARFPGGMDFGQGLVDTNVTMWPLFKALNVDNILTICEIALAPTGRVLFYSRYPAMLGIAVSTIRYLLELRGWNGLALPAVHCRDARIYIEDPGPWLMGMATEARYAVRPSPEVCIVDLDINYLSCASPPTGMVSTKTQRDKYRARLLSTFGEHFHPDHSVPSEFKEAFPAGRFRPVCHVQAGRGATPSAVADAISAPEWWNSTRIIQAFDEVLRARTRPPSFLRRIASLGTPLRAPALSRAELAAQTVIRRRARAFVDAQDELQSRIGRLSRRLNFLMGEADAWRDKFVTFEAYAERLATEASELRAKVQKEQKDARRMSALNAAEKTQLQSKLRETEEAQRKAAIEVAEMREQMRGLEEEREAMIKEVEAQIETAIQAMAVGVDAPGEELDFDSGDEQAGGEAWRRIKSRKNSIASLKKIKSSGHLRSFPTDTTLSEFPPMPVRQKESMESEQSTKASLDKRVDDQDEAAVNLKRFSALANDEDGMVAVDAGIMQSSDRIAQKVQQIQQKLESALSTENVTPRQRRPSKTIQTPISSDSEYSTESFHPTPKRQSRRRGETVTSSHSSNHTTASKTTSARSGRPTTAGSGSGSGTHKKNRGSIASTVRSRSTVTRREPSDADDSDYGTDRPRHRDLPRLATNKTRSPPIAEDGEEVKHISLPAPSPSTPALTPGIGGSTDDSDVESQDYQSAYSMSPRMSRIGSQLDH